MGGVVLITGASSGIGRSTAELLAAQGYRVFGTSRRPDSATLPYTMLPLDVRDAASIARCVQMVIDQAGRIDVLVNNAGIDGAAGASEEISIEQLRALFEVNFFGAVQMTNAVLPVMRGQTSGRIINVSSIAGFIASPPFFGAYCASKFALEGYTEALRYEAKLFNIQVSLVEPGFIRTNIANSSELPALPLDAYEKWRSRVYAADMQAIEGGRDPVVVAKTIRRVIEARSPGLRYPVSEDGLLMSLAKGLLPFRVIEWLFTWLFLLGDWQPDNPGILRRLFLDTRFADRANVYMLGAGVLVVVLVVFFVAFGR